MKQSWSDLTISDYFNLLDIQTAEMSPEDKLINIIALLNNITIDDLNKMSLDESIKYSRNIEFLEKPIDSWKGNTVKINNKDFFIKYNLTTLNISEYIDLVFILEKSNNDLKQYLSVVLSYIMKPIKDIKKNILGKFEYTYIDIDKEELAKWLYYNCPITVAFSIMGFFLKVIQTLTRKYQTSLEIQKKKLKIMKYLTLNKSKRQTIQIGLDLLDSLPQELMILGIEHTT